VEDIHSGLFVRPDHRRRRSTCTIAEQFGTVTVELNDDPDDNHDLSNDAEIAGLLG
jgi:hypothetical protein